jgi:hypothetical protein
MKWSLTDLLLFVLLAGIVLGVYRAFWGEAWLNAKICALMAYLFIRGGPD